MPHRAAPGVHRGMPVGEIELPRPQLRSARKKQRPPEGGRAGEILFKLSHSRWDPVTRAALRFPYSLVRNFSCIVTWALAALKRSKVVQKCVTNSTLLCYTKLLILKGSAGLRCDVSTNLTASASA